MQSVRSTNVRATVVTGMPFLVVTSSGSRRRVRWMTRPSTLRRHFTVTWIRGPMRS